ncbi:hypothetical protein H5R92_00885 [Limosilactobacillus sp. BG-MG3-A]|uniref:DNA-entry nuclease n=1 Tax=Limosilactobacillus agrestis TaxID=2759748 RepID=A0A7W3UG25_9LACO|nr:hypothetical protein [Limosilactobacillus agrestis]MBB1094776.1 hypothetical protein [Limosilactobacillus agrestis]MBB1099847.1 hypothetical protein [Limosilactobacillus agrestis]MCD7113093.1 hypothetical protein [Limosilactobacillus agrestis]MCD7126030.1 hypothetical protein [Limosilactobacillus agrestis]
MKSKGTGTAICVGIALFVIIWLFKILMFLGIIASVVAIIYFGVKVYQENDNRKHLLLTRLLPSLIALIVFSGLYGAINNTTKEVSHSASSSKISSSSSSKKGDDDSGKSKDESTDDESDSDSSDNYDDSSTESNDNYDTNSEDSSTTTSNDNNDTDIDTTKGDMETDQQGTIVGNSRTMVYHTPDQQGYRMNSANAVYFNTEAEAQAAGYRKSAR